MIFHIDSKQSKRIMTERELRTIVDVSHEDGVIEEAEKDMLNNVFVLFFVLFGLVVIDYFVLDSDIEVYVYFCCFF